MGLGVLEKFSPNSSLRQWARSRTFAGTSKPHSLYICGFRRKNFYKLMALLFLIVLAIALAVGISVSNRVRRIRAQRNGVVGANGSRPGVTLPGGRIFIPTTTRTVTQVTREGDRVFTIQYEQPEGITLQLSRGSIVPATSFINLNSAGPATFTFGRVLTTVEGGSTQVVTGMTSVISPTATVTSAAVTMTLGPLTTIIGALTMVTDGRTFLAGGTPSVISPTATVTSSNVVATLGPTTMIIEPSTRISGGRTRTTYTSIPYTVTNSAPSGAPTSSVRVLIYNDPGGGVIVVPADQSSSSRRIITLSSVSPTSRPPTTPSSSQIPGSTAVQSSQNSAPSSSSAPAPQPSPPSGGGGGNGQTRSGDATYYDPGLGSCGITNSASDLIAAIGHALFDSMATPNSNNNPFCGRQIVVRPSGGFNRRSKFGSSGKRWHQLNQTHPDGGATTFVTRTRTGAGSLKTAHPGNSTRSTNGSGHDDKSPT